MKKLRALILLSLIYTGALCQQFVPELIYGSVTVPYPRYTYPSFVTSDGSAFFLNDYYTVAMIEGASGQYLRAFSGNVRAYNVAFAYAADRVALASARQVFAYDALTGNLLGSFTSYLDIDEIAFTPDGRYLYVLEYGVHRLDLQTGNVQLVSNYRAWYGSSWISHDGSRFVGTTHFGRVEVRELPHMGLFGAFGSEAMPARAARVLPGARHVVVGVDQGNETRLQIRNANMSQLIREFSPVVGSCKSVDISPDGRWAVMMIAVDSNTNYKKVYAYELSTGRTHTLLDDAGMFAIVFGFSFFEGSLYLARTFDESKFDFPIEKWDLDTLQKTVVTRLQTGQRIPLAYSPDSKMIMVGHSTNGRSPTPQLQLLDANTFAIGRTYERFGHTNLIVSGAFNNSGARFYSGARDTTIKVWNLRSGLMVRTLPDNDQFPLDIDVSPRTDDFAAGFGSEYGTTQAISKVWGDASWNLKHYTTSNWERQVGVHFARTASYFVQVRTGGEIRWYDDAHFTPIRTLRLDGCNKVAFSEKHQMIAVAYHKRQPNNDYHAFVSLAPLNPSSSDPVRTIRIPSANVQQITFVPGSNFVAVATSQLSFARPPYKFWFVDVYTHQAIEVSLPIESPIEYLHFSPNGKQIAIYRDDNTLLVYRNPAFQVTGDANGDGCVDFIDFQIVVKETDEQGFMLDGDVNNDGTVDLDDLAIVLERLGNGC